MAVLVHLSSLAIQISGPLVWQTPDPKYAMEIAILAVVAVFVLASWAGAALAASRRNSIGMGLQLLAPPIVILSGYLDFSGFSLIILGFGGQGLHALFLGLAAVEPVEPEKQEPGFTPVA